MIDVVALSRPQTVLQTPSRVMLRLVDAGYAGPFDLPANYLSMSELPAPTGPSRFLVREAVSGACSLLSGWDDGGFTSVVSAYLPQQTGGSQPVVGDFNGDGVADFALADGRSLVVELSQGDGGFRLRSWDAGLDVNTVSLVAGDMNGDGFDDLIAVQGYMPTRSTRYLGRSSGDFALGESLNEYADGVRYPARRLADVNGDGILDVIWARAALPPDAGPLPTFDVELNAPDGGPLAWMGVGAGVPNSLSMLPVNPVVADVNGDARLDVLVFRGLEDGGSLIETFLATDAGFMLSHVVELPGFNYLYEVRDIDGDGIPDLVGNSRPDGSVAWIKGPCY